MCVSLQQKKFNRLYLNIFCSLSLSFSVRRKFLFWFYDAERASKVVKKKGISTISIITHDRSTFFDSTAAT